MLLDHWRFWRRCGVAEFWMDWFLCTDVMDERMRVSAEFVSMLMNICVSFLSHIL